MVAVANGAGGPATFHWLATTHLGVPVSSSNSAGTATTLTGVTLLGFPGQTQTFADLYYNQYRDYDPTTGRYIQADPIGLNGDPNPYVYAGANPVGMVDPMGLRAHYGLLFGGISMAMDAANQAGQNVRCGRDPYNWQNYNYGSIVISGLIGGATVGGGYLAGATLLPRYLRSLGIATKGSIGELLSIGSQTARGSRLIGTQIRIPGYRTVADSMWRSRSGRIYYVESKFGLSSLRPAQREARDGLGTGYVVERWTYEFFGNVGGGIGAGIGGATGAEIQEGLEE